MAASTTFDRGFVWQPGIGRAHGGDDMCPCAHDPIVHSFILCPPLELGARYQLVRRDASGSRVLREGRADHAHAPLNLAIVRQTGAQLGATEVHVWNGRAP